MTVFAGYISLSNEQLSEKTKGILKTQFELSCNNKVSYEYISKHQALFSFNQKLYGEHNYVESDNYLTTVAGDPILNSPMNKDTYADIGCLNKSFSQKNIVDLLKKARGVFSGVSINLNSNDTCLYVDKLGIRPLFYYRHNNILIYSSTLSFLEALPFVCLEKDIFGLCEHMGFGYSLGDKTIYKFIKRMGAGEILNVSTSANKLSSTFYWDWNDHNVKAEWPSTDIVELFESFDDSIKIRSNRAKAVAFLSGGLDSRAITALVNKYSERVHTFNFATQHTQDNEYAKKYARLAAFEHNEVILPHLSFPNWSQLISDAAKDNKQLKDSFSNGGFVWSGDGGSVSLGGVYLNEDILSNFKQSLSIQGVELLFKSMTISLPSRFFKRMYHKEIKNLLLNSTLKELKTFDHDPSKVIYNFLMDNDQKRHLQQHFETICEHKIELHLPFFDSEFIAKLYAIPTLEFINHSLYMKWFDLFPEFSRMTPWQTYPKHITCPIAVTDDYADQWQSKTISFTQRCLDFKFVISSRNEFIYEYLSYIKIISAMLLHLFGIKDYSYLVKILTKFTKNKP